MCGTLRQSGTASLTLVLVQRSNLAGMVVRQVQPAAAFAGYAVP
jgi:hypothetical protein